VVKIAATHDEFIDLCRRETLQPDESAITRGIRMAQENQWDKIVERLEAHIEDALNSNQKPVLASESEVEATIA
jgi:hypothetical protein